MQCYHLCNVLMTHYIPKKKFNADLRSLNQHPTRFCNPRASQDASACKDTTPCKHLPAPVPPHLTLDHRASDWGSREAREADNAKHHSQSFPHQPTLIMPKLGGIYRVPDFVKSVVKLLNVAGKRLCIPAAKTP
jgi:hypothetical protein